MKNIKLYMGIAALLCVGFFIYKYVQNARKLDEIETANSKMTKAIQVEAKEIKRKVDEKGIETVIFDITGNRGATDKLMSNEGTKGIIDTTAMALDIRTKQLKEITIIKSSLEAENLKLKSMVDANNRPYYTYSGNGLQLKFTPPFDKDTIGYADFKADVKIKATQYWKRSWFLGSKKSILAVSSDNPMFKINGAEYVEFEQKQPTFGLRLQASTNFNPQSGAVGFGPAARIDLGRFSFQGNYTWYPESERWRPGVTANFDLIRF
jgi:hypothetical protein